MEHLENKQFEKKTIQSNSLISGMYEETSKGLTDNGALTYIRSGSALLDMYAQAGAMRKNPEKAVDLFKKAFSEDREKAIRILFYLRDIRGGQGERDLFRNCLAWLGSSSPEIFEKIVHFVPEYGRWDDLFFDNKKCIELIKDQLERDLNSETPSLLAKWLPTANASSKRTKQKAKFFASSLGMNVIEYRHKIRTIRTKLAIVEEKMCLNEWDKIDYSTVPSQANRIYGKAFKRHDTDRYSEFIEKARTGEVKINASTLYPYQIYNSMSANENITNEALWKQLPDYTQGKNALIVADVSGSMSGIPMSVSVSLALYFAERNMGQFRDHFITFSENPQLQRITGNSLSDKMNSIENSDWGMNTDLQKVFDLILTTGLDRKIPQSEMPETIYIISDMEFDVATGSELTNFKSIQSKYQNAGYLMPTLVFWNVNASGNNLPVMKNEQNVTLVSGFSPVIFKIAVENKTPEQVMLDTINSKRYSNIIL